MYWEMYMETAHLFLLYIAGLLMMSAPLLIVFNSNLNGGE
jgi:hypothetical protein